MTNFDSINLGFSHEAQFYEADDAKNPIIISLRKTIRTITAKYIPVNRSILEINAGSGLDALWFAQQGYRIHATDIADGMLFFLQEKVKTFDKPEQFTFQKLSFTELEHAQFAPFDAIFSNFGGLNCTDDLSAVVRGVKKVLKPKGYIVWVFMSKICLWEIAQLLLGRINIATRRFKKNGVQANVRGVLVHTHYFSAKHVIKTLGSDFEVIHLQSLSLFAPPMNQTGFINRFPRVINFLLRIDEFVGKLPFFNRCGDFLILAARYYPKTDVETNRY